MEEIKQLHDEMLKSVKEHREYVEKEIQELKKTGVVAPETKSALDKLNDRISDVQKEIDALTLKTSQPPADSGHTNTPELIAYKKSFDAFVRKGIDTGLRDLEMKAMSVASDPDGGYTVTPDMSGQIVKKVFDTTPWRQYCSTQTISTASLEGLEDRGEVGSGWVAEQGTRTETSSPEIGKWSIPVHELYAEPRATQKLLDDSSVDIESWLVGKIAEKFARVQNNAFVNGSGVDKPRGFATYPTAATPDSTRPWGTIEHVATGNAGAFPSSNPADVLMDVIYALKATYRQGAMWACPKEVLGEIRKMKDSDGQYLWRPGLSEGEPSRLLDYAIIESEDIPALAAGSLSVAFGNFSRAYQIVDRIGIRVLRDPFTSKPYVKFYTTTRVGGAVIDYEALKFVKFS